MERRSCGVLFRYYTRRVHIEFDPAKSARNERERGLSFERASGFDFEGALVKSDLRRAYPEPRYIAVGFLGARLHVLCFNPVAEGIRVISFRKANAREVRDHAEVQSQIQA